MADHEPWMLLMDRIEARGWRARIDGASESTSSVYLAVDRAAEVDRSGEVLAYVVARIRIADHPGRLADDSYDLSLDVSPTGLSIDECIEELARWMEIAPAEID